MTLRCRPRRWRAQDFAPYSRSNPAPPGLVFAPDTQGSRIGAGLATKRAVQRHPQEDTALMAQKFTLNVNGSDHTVEADPDMPLLYALRNDLGLNNPHFGCGLAQCGACTVHLDGQPIRSCVTPLSAVGDRQGGDARRPRHAREAASAADRLCRGAGAAMRLLHQRLDHDRGRASCATRRSPTDAEIKDGARQASNAAAARIWASCARSSALPR